MRISFVLSSLGLSGGVLAVTEYANRFAQRGHEVTLVTPRGTIDPVIRNKVNSLVRIRESSFAQSRGPQYYQWLRLSWSLANAVPASDVIVTTHTPTTVPGFFASKLGAKGKLVWLYADYPEMFEGRPIEGWLLRHAIRWHTHAVTFTEHSRKELGNSAHDKTTVVGLGLSDRTLFRPVNIEDRSAHDGYTVLYVGDPRPRKGMTDFVEAAAIARKEVPELKVMIVSKMPIQAIDSVPNQIIHRPTRAELIRAYSSCDLFVSASWGEGFGLPPLEAMACATPVVLTDSGGVRDYAVPEENCLMVPPRCPKKMAAAMVRIATDTQLAARLSRNGPSTAEKYTWTKATDRFEEILCAAVG